MDKKFLLLTLSFLCFQLLRSQNESAIMDSLKAFGNYSLELKHRLKIYKNEPTSSQNIYNMACCYALLKKNDSAFYYLNKSIDLGQDEGFALADCDFDNLHLDHRWEEIENKLAHIYWQKNANVNTQLAWDISKMFFADQASKAASDVVFKRYGLPSPQMDSMDRVIGDIDSMNILNLEKLFNKYGWMGKELIGLEAVNRVFIILLHAPLSYQKKYFNFIEAAVNKGELQKQCIAYLTDKILAKKGKKQLYGTQLQYSRETKSYHFKPIENEKDVNSRRKEYGLRPIEDYAKDFGIDYRVQ